MANFKVGDRVEVVNSCQPAIMGKLGEVVDICHSGVFVRFDDPELRRYHDVGSNRGRIMASYRVQKVASTPLEQAIREYIRQELTP